MSQVLQVLIIVQIQQIQQIQENKGDKMQMLYDYLTGNEFRGQMEAIAEGFMSLRSGIVKERIQMEKIWKEREKQIDKVTINTIDMHASIKGIAGNAIQSVKALELPRADDDLELGL